MPMKNPPHSGEIIRDLYIEPLELTVTQAAAGLGVSRKTLSMLLNGLFQVTCLCFLPVLQFNSLSGLRLC